MTQYHNFTKPKHFLNFQFLQTRRSFFQSVKVQTTQSQRTYASDARWVFSEMSCAGLWNGDACAIGFVSNKTVSNLTATMQFETVGTTTFTVYNMEWADVAPTATNRRRLELTQTKCINTLNVLTHFDITKWRDGKRTQHRLNIHIYHTMDTELQKRAWTNKN